MNIEKQNILIAEFMGATLHKDWTSAVYKNPADTLEFNTPPTEYSSKFWLPSELEYHKSYEWIMPVIEKIEKYTADKKKITISICDNTSVIAVGTNIIFAADNRATKIIAIYEAIIYFIEHVYNPIKQTPYAIQ